MDVVINSHPECDYRVASDGVGLDEESRQLAAEAERTALLRFGGALPPFRRIGDPPGDGWVFVADQDFVPPSRSRFTRRTTLDQLTVELGGSPEAVAYPVVLETEAAFRTTDGRLGVRIAVTSRAFCHWEARSRILGHPDPRTPFHIDCGGTTSTSVTRTAAGLLFCDSSTVIRY